LEANKLKNDYCFDWKIVNSHSSFEVSSEKASETFRIIDKRKTKDFEELKHLFNDFDNSQDETVAYSPKNIKYCI